MEITNKPSSMDTALKRRTQMIDKLLDEGFTPEQIMMMAQSREKDKQEEKMKEADIAQLEDEIKAKFDVYLNAVGAEDVEVSDLKLDDLFNIIKGKYKPPYRRLGLTREEYEEMAEEVTKELRKVLKEIGVEI
jgi:DNA-binding transcriptional MerR regulator